jgi:hypothetical protein
LESLFALKGALVYLGTDGHLDDCHVQAEELSMTKLCDDTISDTLACAAYGAHKHIKVPETCLAVVDPDNARQKLAYLESVADAV